MRVFVTGHTGFKGAWLCSWLKVDGAKVTGFSLPPAATPNLFDAARVAEGLDSVFGDVRDGDAVLSAMRRAEPDIVFHLAAQPLVRQSYFDPIATFATNAMGTAQVLEAARHCPSVRAIVCVTTDKVYKSEEWVWGYRENDTLGGKDPYSASKACAELVAASYRDGFFSKPGSVRLATARGGNVVGGGDWSPDRLVPDLVRAFMAKKPIVLRNPTATRPWQHVLDLLSGYLLLGERMLSGDDVAGAWNFGPDRGNEVDVGTLARRFFESWGDELEVQIEPSTLAETRSLRLDSSKALLELGWERRLDIAGTLSLTSSWYRRNLEGVDAQSLIHEQIEAYRQSPKQ